MPKRSFKVVEDDIAFLEKIRQENSLFSVDEAHSFVFEQLRKGKTAFEGTIPEKCKSCPKCGFIIKNGKLLCITKKTETDPIRGDWIPLEVVGACAEKTFNTPINRKTREQFERELSNMEKMKIYHQNRADELRPKAERLPTVERQLTEILKELEEASKGKEDLLNGKSTLESRVFAMKNALLERDDKIAVLETDNEQLREKVEELSHDKLFELTQLQKVQLAQKDKQLSDYALEIKKIEALNEKQGQTINEIISKTNSTFRDFKQFLPTSLEAYDIQQYIKAVQKKIEMFEGYLNTIAS